ncbi:MAG TPA: hypothetical protein VGJ50_29740 [Streptosporangiaceae bacterium]|jgi:hypothetical protein
MTETRIWSYSRIRPACAQAPVAGSGRGRRIGARLWSLLHAPALLSGPGGGPHEAAFVEDDYRRLGGRQAG